MQQGVSQTDDTSNSNGCEEGIEVVACLTIEAAAWLVQCMHV
jgi:hypothetical protein